MDIHYTWSFAAYLHLVLRWLHEIGFFNFYVYFPLLSAVGVALYVWMFVRVRRNGAYADSSRAGQCFWHVILLSVSWLASASFFVAFKLMIVEELDYQERKWFEWTLAPSHLYIASLAVAYLWLVAKNRSSALDLWSALYLQIGLLAGYAVATYRVFNEAVEGASGGASLFLFFAAINYDLVQRMRRQHPLRAAATLKAGT